MDAGLPSQETSVGFAWKSLGLKPRRLESSPRPRQDHFEYSQMDNQESVSRREDVPVRVGDLILLSTKDLVSLKDKTSCPRLSSRFVGPFRVTAPPGPECPNHGPSKNFVWLALPPLPLGLFDSRSTWLGCGALRSVQLTLVALQRSVRVFHSPRSGRAIMANTLTRCLILILLSSASVTNCRFSCLVITTHQIIINTHSPDRTRCVLMIHIEMAAR